MADKREARPESEPETKGPASVGVPFGGEQTTDTPKAETPQPATTDQVAEAPASSTAEQPVSEADQLTEEPVETRYKAPRVFACHFCKAKLESDALRDAHEENFHPAKGALAQQRQERAERRNR